MTPQNAAMPRQPHYNAAHHIPPAAAADPYQRPAFPARNRARRLLWNLTRALLYRPSPRPLHAWRAFLLRCFGATLGPGCIFYPASRVWAPWNLTCADSVVAADGVEIYNPAPIHLGSHVILSQDAYLCGATHDYDSPDFPLLAYASQLDAYAWVCARASVAPGVNLGEGAVLGLGSVATRDLAPWTINAGVPAIRIKDRQRTVLLEQRPAASE
jgi:putative colanic acid biosynthesis acetyltransferase WcaF